MAASCSLEIFTSRDERSLCTGCIFDLADEFFSILIRKEDPEEFHPLVHVRGLVQSDTNPPALCGNVVPSDLDLLDIPLVYYTSRSGSLY